MLIIAAHTNQRAKKMLTLEEIREKLRAYNLKTVADDCNIHYNTVRAIASGEHTNPTYNITKKLSEYLSK